jgi:hypothetical protein
MMATPAIALLISISWFLPAFRIRYGRDVTPNPSTSRETSIFTPCVRQDAQLVHRGEDSDYRVSSEVTTEFAEHTEQIPGVFSVISVISVVSS